MIDLGMAWKATALVPVPQGTDLPTHVKSRQGVAYNLLSVGQVEFDGPLLAVYVITALTVKLADAAVESERRYRERHNDLSPKFFENTEVGDFVTFTVILGDVVPFEVTVEGRTWRLSHGDRDNHQPLFTAFYDELTGE